MNKQSYLHLIEELDRFHASNVNVAKREDVPYHLRHIRPGFDSGIFYMFALLFTEDSGPVVIPTYKTVEPITKYFSHYIKDPTIKLRENSNAISILSRFIQDFFDYGMASKVIVRDEDESWIPTLLMVSYKELAYAAYIDPELELHAIHPKCTNGVENRWAEKKPVEIIGSEYISIKDGRISIKDLEGKGRILEPWDDDPCILILDTWLDTMAL